MRILWAVLPLLIATPVFAVTKPKPKPPATSQGVLGRARTSVLSMLNDPSSAQFREVHIAPDKDRPRVCGEVNSKNGYGGYVGYQPFVYFPDTDESEIFDGELVSPDYAKKLVDEYGTCFKLN